MILERHCEWCGNPLPWRMRLDARFCSARCRVASNRNPIPSRLTGMDRWCCAMVKRPIRIDGRPASSTDPGTWSSFAAVCRSKHGTGAGFMLGGGIGCYDLDHCSDDDARAFASGVPEPVIYCERSRSGSGFHLFIEAPELRGWRLTVDGLRVERYTRDRFIVVTGDRIRLQT